MKGAVAVQVQEIPWETVNFATGIRVKKALKKSDTESNLRLSLLEVEAGHSVPVHKHAERDNLYFVVKGRGKMLVKGAGDIDLRCDTLVRVPRDAEHQIYDVEEELLIVEIAVD